MAANTVTFTYGSTSVTVAQGQSYPEHPGKDLNQARNRAMGGRVVTVTRSSAPIQQMAVHLIMTNAEYTSMDSFIISTIIGSEHQFVFNDYENTDHDVKYMGGWEAVEKSEALGDDSWEATLALAVV